MLEMGGCLATTGAMGCRKEIARGTVDRGADCLLAVREKREDYLLKVLLG